MVTIMMTSVVVKFIVRLLVRLSSSEYSSTLFFLTNTLTAFFSFHSCLNRRSSMPIGWLESLTSLYSLSAFKAATSIVFNFTWIYFHFANSFLAARVRSRQITVNGSHMCYFFCIITFIVERFGKSLTMVHKSVSSWLGFYIFTRKMRSWSTQTPLYSESFMLLLN